MKYENVLFLTIQQDDSVTYFLNILKLYYSAFDFSQSVIDELVMDVAKNDETFKEINCSDLLNLLIAYKNSVDYLKKQGVYNQNGVSILCEKNAKETDEIIENSEIKKAIEIIKAIKIISQEVYDKLIDVYKGNSSISIFDNILKQLLEDDKTVTIGIELNYVDRIYRDSYYNFFSNLHEDFSRRCKRLVFFEDQETYSLLKKFVNAKKRKKPTMEKLLNEKFIGSMVIRPLKTGAIGRTLFNPNKFLKNNEEFYVRTSQWKISFLGLELSVKAFPFLMQDGITTSCAETVLLALMDYYSQQYNDYKFVLPSAINDINMRENGTRAIPTNGLSYETMSKILCEFGFYTTFDCKFSKNELRRFLYYYIESGIPIIINMQIKDKESSFNSGIGHAALCIGHGEKDVDNLLDNIEYENGVYYANTALAHNKIYVMDDNLRPYSCYAYNYLNSSSTNQKCFMERDDQKNLDIDCYIVPLHKHMYMDAKRAEDIIRELLSSKSEKKVKQYNPATYYKEKTGNKEEIEIGTIDNPIIYRLFLASSRHLKHHRMMLNDNKLLFDLYAETPMPHFVWVCEFYTKESYSDDNPFAIGEIVIDATRCAKSSLFSSVLMINYSGSVHYVRNFTNENFLPKSSKKQAESEQDKIILQTAKNNRFKIAPYNLNLRDKNFFNKK